MSRHDSRPTPAPATVGSGTRRDRWARALRTEMRSTSYLRRWLVLGAAIGLVAGLGAIVFYEALRLGTHFLLESASGGRVATPVGEGGRLATSPTRPWLVPLIVAAGGLASGIIVFTFAPEAEGHGTDAAIHAVHNNPKGLRARVAAVKIIASALTIGSGGSGGREGPTAQISATFGSVLARRLNLSPSDARLAVATGMAAGIASIFRAPLGGALLGAELLYRDDIEVEALVPSLVASIVGFTVFGSVEGFTPIFGFHTGAAVTSPAQLVWFLVLGLVAGLFGRLYSSTFYGAMARFKKVRLPAAARPALAGIGVGVIGLAVPGVLGTGYGEVQQVMSRTTLMGIPLWVVLALPFAKILATSLSIGSGGSGGIFGPGMVIGGAAGAALWRVLEPVVPGIPHAPLAFVVVGMASCFGAIAHAPLAVMLMVAEMTGSLGLLPPAMLAIAAATLVVGNRTIYSSQLARRSDSPAHRLSSGLPASASVPVGRAMADPRVLLSAQESIEEAVTRLAAAGLHGAPVVNESGVFLGVVDIDGLERALSAGSVKRVGALADGTAPALPMSAGIDAAMDAVVTSPHGWVPVLDDDLRVAGIVAVSDLLHGYRAAMRDSVRRLGRSSSRGAVREMVVEQGSSADGVHVRDLGLPHGVALLSVARGEDLTFATADTELRHGDVVTVLSHAGRTDEVVEVFAGSQGAHRAGTDRTAAGGPGPADDGAGQDAPAGQDLASAHPEEH